MSGRVLVDPEKQYLLGQPTSGLKELYQNSEKAPTGLRIGVLANPSYIVTNELWKPAK
jgi:ribosomal protein S6--L-glutamate ligase